MEEHLRRLVVVAHYDPFGEVAPHVLRHVAALGEVADRLLVVTTAALTDEARAALGGIAEVVERDNYGYDFYSYKTGLDHVDDLTAYDEVVVCNDSFVGPLRPYPAIFDAMAGRQVDVWGMTLSRRRTLHLQSFFVVFRRWVVGSQAFAGFWRRMTPVSDRREVITRYEIGMSRAMLEAGFVLGSYFEEDERDARLAGARHLWQVGSHVVRLPRRRWLSATRRLAPEPWNPMAALADRALDDARLPVVKLDTLRYDPYRLGSDMLLAKCEQRYPEAFAGVRDFLQRTAAVYPLREHENGPTTPPPGVRQLLGY